MDVQFSSDFLNIFNHQIIESEEAEEMILSAVVKVNQAVCVMGFHQRLVSQKIYLLG